MSKAKESLEQLTSGLREAGSWLRRHPVKAGLTLGLAGLIAVTGLKDNVYFGSTTLHNPKENAYVWGLIPILKIEGKAKGNFYCFGLMYGEISTGDDSQITGDVSAYGLLVGGVNELGDNSQITGDMSAYGLVLGGNGFGDKSQITGDMSAHGLITGVNKLGNDSQIIGDMTAYSLLFGFDDLRDNSQITGDMSAHGLITGVNKLGNNSQITGDMNAWGILAFSPDFGLGVNRKIGLENYIHKEEEK